MSAEIKLIPLEELVKRVETQLIQYFPKDQPDLLAKVVADFYQHLTDENYDNWLEKYEERYSFLRESLETNIELWVSVAIALLANGREIDFKHHGRGVGHVSLPRIWN